MVTKAKQKTEEEEKEEEEEGQEGTEDDKDSKDSGKPPAAGGDLEGHIRKVVKDVVDGLLGNGDKAARSTPANDESTVLQMVKDAQEKLRKEEERESKFKTVEESVETLKKVVEKAPARDGIGGKVSRFMWGSE